MEEETQKDVSMPVAEGGADSIQPTPLVTEEATSHARSIREFFMHIKWPKAHVFTVIVVLAILGIAMVSFFSKDTHVAVKQFTNVYSFVPEKISKSAQIQINLPEGVSEEVAINGISFSPELEGEWKPEDIDGVVIFKPSTPLKVGVYYAVNMDTGSVQMSGDFFVDEDPQIDAVFPAAGSETHEDSEITIVFNRPMVPLTTLSEQESKAIPISITPATPGRFKWISTRNLQFIPETTLVPSSEYTVEVKEGLSSRDGL